MTNTMILHQVSFEARSMLHTLSNGSEFIQGFSTMTKPSMKYTARVRAH